MGRFKKGDKVVLGEKAFRDAEGSLLISEVCGFLMKNKFLTVGNTSSSSSHCDIEEFPQYIFEESWLEPYSPDIEQGPLTLLTEDGLSVRDRFAMAALKGLLSSGKDCVITEPSFLARVVYSIADAMMEVRKI